MCEFAIVGEKVVKKFQLYQDQKQRMMSFLLGKGGKAYYAIKGISFAIKKGDSVGLIGLNGSGKSTLANMLAGISIPSAGRLTINGTANLIAISSGLNIYLTGMENITLKGLMIGLTMSEIEDIRNDIISFADIGQFINQPVKTYSSGMKARLSFSIAVHINPDIVIIDEALSVGDSSFTTRCLEKMNNFRKQGKTLIFVSHSLSQVRTFCNKAMWLENGVMRGYGEVNEIADQYESFLNEFNSMTPQEQEEYKRLNYRS